MEKLSKDLQRSGIYMIVNQQNGKRYIGSSKDIYTRLQCHRAELRHNNHYNPHLQAAWNKYKEHSFNYTVLEYCKESKLIEREQYYVNTLKPEYNISVEIVQLPSYSEESRAKHSKTRKERIASGLIPKTHCTKIYVYDLEGNFIAEFPSLAETSRTLGIYKSSIDKVLAGSQNRAHNYRFFREPQNNLSPYKRKKKVCETLWKSIIVENETEHYEFKNAKECAEYFKVHLVYIRQAIAKNLNFKRKYKIYYKSAVLQSNL